MTPGRGEGAGNSAAVVAPVWPRWPRRAATPLPARTDVLVIGGGITGASLIRHVDRRRLDAVLVERGRLACGASGRNAGFLLCGGADNYAVAVRRYGRGLAAEVWEFTRHNLALMAEALGERAGHRQVGSWNLAASPAEAEELEESASLLNEDGFDAEFTRALPDSMRDFAAGLLVADGGEVDPVAAVHTIAAEGSRVVEGVTVRGIEASATGVRVDTTSGECAADMVILATNAMTPALVPEVAITPQRGQMLASAPWSRRIVTHPVYADRGFRYWRQLAGGRVLVGGFRDRALDEEATDDDTVTEPIQRLLDAQLRDLGVGAPVTHRWAGVMGFTADHLPMVGPVPGRPGVFMCGGYSGHGMGFALHAAERLCDLVFDHRQLPEWMSAQRLVAPATTG